jgi:ribosomal-protein-alanine N-acetyltransferase
MTPAALADLHARAMSVPPPWSQTDFLTLLAAPGVFLCGDPQGFALGRVAADEAELLTIAVAPEARRQGLGRARLSAFQAEAARRGAVTAYLEVAETNAAARALYDAAGWVEAGRRRGYYRAEAGPAIDALVMTRRLAPTPPARA